MFTFLHYQSSNQQVLDPCGKTPKIIMVDDGLLASKERYYQRLALMIIWIPYGWRQCCVSLAKLLDLKNMAMQVTYLFDNQNKIVFYFHLLFPYFLVNGAVLNIRPKFIKIALWLAESEVEQIVTSIGQIFKNRLENQCFWNLSMIFEVHRDTMEKTSSTVKYKYRI